MRALVRACAAVAALALPACGGPELPPPVDPADAARQLTAALEAWKVGEPHTALEAKQPPIVFVEPLWKDGARLLAFELGPVEMHGRQARCTAKLTVEPKGGKAVERKIGYQIDTVPRVVIVREGLGP